MLLKPTECQTCTSHEAASWPASQIGRLGRSPWEVLIGIGQKVDACKRGLMHTSILKLTKASGTSNPHLGEAGRVAVHVLLKALHLGLRAVADLRPLVVLLNFHIQTAHAEAVAAAEAAGLLYLQ